MERAFHGSLSLFFPGLTNRFMKKFTSVGGNESVVLRYSPVGMPVAHLVLAMNPGDIYLWAQNKNLGGNGNKFYQEKYMQTNGKAKE